MSTFKPKIIAIDGPAGSGKSVISSKLAAVLGWRYVNTGELYRAVAFIAKELGVSEFSQQTLEPVLDEIIDGLYWNCDSNTVWYKNRDLSTHIKGTAAGQDASKVSKLAVVRSRLLDVQRRLALSAQKGAILEGRDIGTVVFPDADLKIFLYASPQVRATRRYHQLKSLSVLDPNITIEQIEQDLKERDEADSKRTIAPMKKAEDCIEVDTSDLNIDEVVSKIISILESKNLFV